MSPLRPRYSRIEREVRALLERHSVMRPAVPVDTIAAACGAEVKFNRFNHEVSGLLLRSDSGVVIAVEQDQGKTRQRFTISHELGHLILHEGKPVRVDKHFRLNLRSKASSTAEDVEEIEANAFAASLLMPAHFLSRDVASITLDVEDPVQLENLARRYEVSPQAMTFRLLNLFSARLNRVR